MNNYIAGELVKCTSTFLDENRVVQDPTTVMCIYKPPGSGSVQKEYPTDPEIIKESTGVYSIELDTTGLSGIWYYRFFSTGDHQAAAQNKFTVKRAVPANIS